MTKTTVHLNLWLWVLGVVFFVSANAAGKESKDPMALAFKTLSGEGGAVRKLQNRFWNANWEKPRGKFMLSLLITEKTEFLKYFLALSLQDWASSQPRPPKFFTLNKKETFSKSLNIAPESIEKFESMNIPKESRKKLLDWTKTEFKLSTKNVLELVKREKVNGKGFFPDIGVLCCPW